MSDKEVIIKIKIDKNTSEADMAKITKAQQSYSDAISKTGQAVKQINTSKAEHTRLLKLEKVASTAAKGSINQLSAQYSLNIIKLKAMSAEERTASVAGRALNSQTAAISAQMKKLDSSIGSNVRNVGNYGTKLKNFGKQLIAGYGVMFAIRAVTGLVKDSIAVFRAFEKGQSTLAAVLQTTKDKTIALSASALKLGVSTKFTSKEVTDLQIAYARLGFTQQEILDQTEATLSGATALQAELGSMAELTGASLRSFGKDSKESTQVVDAMVLSTQKSALSFEKLNVAIPIVGSAAHAVGDSFESMLGKLGTASNAGIEASTSATALRNIYIELAKSGMSYNEAMDDINGSTDRLSRANQLFGKRGAVVALTLAANVDKADDLTKALNHAGGAAKEFADKELDNLDGSMVKFGSMWDGIKQKIGSSTGALRTFIDSLTDFGNSLGDTADDQAAKTAEAYFETIQKGAKASGSELISYSQSLHANNLAIAEARKFLNEQGENDIHSEFIRKKIRENDLAGLELVGGKTWEMAKSLMALEKTNIMVKSELSDINKARDIKDIKEKYDLTKMSSKELADLQNRFLTAKTDRDKAESEVMLEDVTRALTIRQNKEIEADDNLLKLKDKTNKALAQQAKDLDLEGTGDEAEEDKDFEEGFDKELEATLAFEAKKKEMIDNIRLANADDDQDREEIQAELDAEKREAALEKMGLDAEEERELKLMLKEQEKQELLDIENKYAEKKNEVDEKALKAKLKMNKLEAGAAKALSNVLSGILGDSLAGQIASVAVEAAVQSAILGVKSSAAQASNLAIATAVGPPANFATIPIAVGQNATMAANTAAAIGGIWTSAAISAGSKATQSFANGGIVQGQSFTGDNVQVNTNSGEMISNQRQKDNLLLAVANGSGAGGGMSQQEVIDTIIGAVGSIPVVISEQAMTSKQKEVYEREVQFEG